MPHTKNGITLAVQLGKHGHLTFNLVKDGALAINKPPIKVVASEGKITKHMHGHSITIELHNGHLQIQTDSSVLVERNARGILVGVAKKALVFKIS